MAPQRSFYSFKTSRREQLVDKPNMDRVFSLNEISDRFWSDAPDELSKMNRSESEWALQRFLQEAQQGSSPKQSSSASSDTESHTVVEIKTPSSNKNGKNVADVNGGNKTTVSFNVGAANGCASNALVDSEDYQTVLKNKLNLACAAVAMSRVSFFPFFFRFFTWVYSVGEI